MDFTGTECKIVDTIQLCQNESLYLEVFKIFVAP